VPVTGYGDVHRLFLVKFDDAKGVLAMDTSFHDEQGQPGFSLESRKWPHGWTGTANAHGVVFSR
jgi:hypothetical protein